MGSSKKVTVGHKYYMGQHQVLCHGPIDYISRITFDADKVAWAGRNTGGTLTVVADSLFGGSDSEGGVSGQIDLMMGRPTQTQNSYLQSILGSVIPAFRGVVSVVFRQFYFGNSAYLKNVSFRGTRTNVKNNGDAQWYLPTASIFSGNLEQPHAIYIAIDRSGSMDTIGGGIFDPSVNNQTRLANAKTAINTTLDYIAGALVSFRLDICIVAWGASSTSITRRSVTASDITALKNWVNALTATGGTNFVQAFNDLDTFFASAPSTARKFAFFVTDGLPDVPGETPLVNAQAAADIVNAQSVPVYAVNIDLSDTQYTAMVDTTFSDGVPVITGGMPAALVQVLMAQLDFQVDMNPAHMLRECCTSNAFGIGLSDSDINDTAFIDVANQLYDERMGMSLLWDSDSMGLDDFMEEICRHIDASHYTDQNGLATVKLIRDDYDVEDLITLDKTIVLSVDSAASTPSTELVNSVTGIYWSPQTGKNASITVSDPALVQMQGRIKSTTLQYPGFTDPAVVARKLSSDLRSLSNSLFSCTIIVNRVPEQLNNGEPFIFNWPELQQYNTIMRVVDIDWGDGRNNDIRISCTQDVFAIPTFPVVSPSPGWVNPSQPPSPSLYRVAIELPYYDLVQGQGQNVVDALLTDDPDVGYLGVAAQRPSGNAINAEIYVNVGAGYSDAGYFDFCPALTFATALGLEDDEVQISNMVDVESVDLIVNRIGQVNGELMVISSIVDTTATLKRAVLDSEILTHPTGSRFLIWDDALVADSTQYVASESVSVRILPVTSMGQLPLESAPTDVVNFDSRAIRPFAPGQVKFNDEYWPVSLQGVVTVTWSHRNRLQQTGGTALGFYDDGITAEVGTTYEIRAYNVADNDLLHAQTGITDTSHMIPADDLSIATIIRIEVSAERDGYSSRAIVTHTCAYLGESNLLQFYDDYTPPDDNDADLIFGLINDVGRIGWLLRGFDGTHIFGNVYLSYPVSQNVVFYSADADAWSTAESAIGFGMSLQTDRMIYADGIYVANGGGSGNWVATTDDIVAGEWETETLIDFPLAGVSSVNTELQSLLHDGTQFVLSGEHGIIVTRTPSTDWVEVADNDLLTVGDKINQMVFDGSYYYAVTTTTIYKSTNLSTWEQVYEFEEDEPIGTFHVVNGELLRVGYKNLSPWKPSILQSTDEGETWTELFDSSSAPSGLTCSFYSAAYFDGLYIFVGLGVSAYSSDLSSFTATYHGTSSATRTYNVPLVVGDGVALSAFSPSIISETIFYKSTDGMSWEED